ncbi:HNH endonuclease [Methylophaga sp. SB9B]|uniref:HNH endonuclease n=1 Tax=Methylophaga sp. SB9B TaxID=2570356 RepID=UPI001B3C16A6|nr:HNH endonuclease [Methylophaga sp. SB9B]
MLHGWVIMIPSCLFSSPDWDFPIYKVLADNDTGNSLGHQGGVLIPKDLRPFFPGLLGTTSASSPTIDSRIQAELFLENTYLSTVSTRYQFQTWGGTRSPESRLTDQLTTLLNIASGGDILLIQRHIDYVNYYKLTLVRKSSAEYEHLRAFILGKKWGPLDYKKLPVSDEDLAVAEDEQADCESSKFNLFDTGASISHSQTKKVARAVTFRKGILSLYDEKCAICSQSFRTPAGLIELDAAHVVPRGMFGTDDSRNGFALCKRHHWAFDKGLFGVGNDRKVVVPHIVASILENHELAVINGAYINEASDKNLIVHPDAFSWHRNNLLIN